MLTVILSILKIIGLILLVVLGLVLFLILLVMLVPIRYKAEASYYEKPKAMANITWLLHSLSVKIHYETEVSLSIRVFGFQLRLPDSDNNSARADIPVETSVEYVHEKTSAPKESLEEDTMQQLSYDEHAGRKSQKKKSDSKKKTVSALDRISETIRNIREKKDEVMESLQNEEYWKTFHLIRKQTISIIKHMLPKDIHGKVRFGMDDPFQTGQILTYISPFYALYAKHLDLTPVFEEKVMEGELCLKGRIRIGTILVKAIRLLFDKNIRKLIRKFRNG